MSILEADANRWRGTWGASVSLFALVGTFIFPTIFPDASTNGEPWASPDVAALAVWTVRHVSLVALGWAARPVLTQAAVQVRLIVTANLDKIRRRIATWLLRDVHKP